MRCCDMRPSCCAAPHILHERAPAAVARWYHCYQPADLPLAPTFTLSQILGDVMPAAVPPWLR